MRTRLLTVAAAGLLIGATALSAPATAAPASQSAAGAASAAAGKGIATAHSVNLRQAAAGQQIPARGSIAAPRSRDGRAAGAGLPVRPSTGRKPTAAISTTRGGPNTGAAPRATTPRVTTPRTTVPGLPSGPVPMTAPSTTNANFAGVNQAGSNCGGCQPPDVNAAVGLTQIVEAVNLRFQVYSKTGAALCGASLNTFLGTTSSLSDPRVQFDNVNNRYSMVVIPIPASSTAAPAEYLLTSQTADACGSWWVYRLTFSGSLFPAGALLDYPYLGQDRVAILSSTNNFQGNTYIGSTAFGIPKSAAYAGAGLSFSAFATAFSTAPVTVGGIPAPPTPNTYWVASVPGTGYRLYRMTNSAGPGTTYTLQATISSTFAAPSRRVNQPGTTQTLDPLDGRIVWAPVQIGSFVWFTHGIDLGGFPAIRYGAISTAANTATVAVAYRSGTSDDFNPSIGVADAGNNTNYIWLNWAYTDTPANVATSDTVDGVTPGAGVPNLIGTGTVLVVGSPTSGNFRFGDYSSVSVDPTAASSTCPAGRTAVTAQQYFTSNGQWATRIGRLSFC